MEKLPTASPPPPGAIGSPRRRWGVSLLAVAVGILTDLGGTNVVSACYSLVVVVPMVRALQSQGLSPTQMQAQLVQSLEKATSGSIVVNGLGILMSILGGYLMELIPAFQTIYRGAANGLSSPLSLPKSSGSPQACGRSHRRPNRLRKTATGAGYRV